MQMYCVKWEVKPVNSDVTTVYPDFKPVDIDATLINQILNQLIQIPHQFIQMSRQLIQMSHQFTRY